MRAAFRTPYLAVAVVSLIGLLAGCSASGEATAFPVIPVKDAFVASAIDLPSSAPDFFGTDVVTGQSISLSQFKGQPVLLNFLDYGCSTTLNEVVSAQLRAIRDLQQQRHDFVPLSVFCGCCPPDVLRDFALRNNLNWPWVLDSDYSIIRTYSAYMGDSGYPILVFIDKEGMVVSSSGAMEIDGVSAGLDTAVAGPTRGDPSY